MLAVQDSWTEFPIWPVPWTPIFSDESAALLLIRTLAPARAPVPDGANVTVIVADSPGVRIVPPETPPTVSPAPATVTSETLMLDCWLFVSVDVKVLLLPTDTLLKFRLAGFALSPVWLLEFAVCPLPAVVKPAQLERPIEAAMIVAARIQVAALSGLVIIAGFEFFSREG